MKSNISKRQNVPSNIATFEKERLYEEKINLKKQRNEVLRENQALKTQVKSVENDLKKKDDLIKRLADELKRFPVTAAIP